MQLLLLKESIRFTICWKYVIIKKQVKYIR